MASSAYVLSDSVAIALFFCEIKERIAKFTVLYNLDLHTPGGGGGAGF